MKRSIGLRRLGWGGSGESRCSDQHAAAIARVDFGGTPEGTKKARNAGWALVKEFLARL